MDEEVIAMAGYLFGWWILIGVFWAVLVGYIGDQKGRSMPLWMISGFFFGLFALIAVCAVPKIDK